MLSPSSVTVGTSALRATWAQSTRVLAEALRAGRRDEVGVEDLDHPDPEGPDEQRHDRERSRQRRQDEPAEMRSSGEPPSPPTGNQCRCTAKISIRTMPNQNAGIPSPTTESRADDVVGCAVLPGRGHRRQRQR